jgi:AraC family transcriptional regulator
MDLQVKNMVCDRCKKVVKEELEGLGLEVVRIELGDIEISQKLGAVQLAEVRQRLEENGFELLDDQRQALVEQIRTLVIEEVQHFKGNKPEYQNFSDYLSQKSGYDYSYLSHLFSTETGSTIEQYLIAQRIEKVKEWLSYNELSISEMAWKLGYSSASHLANQFKKVTGCTPGQYKKNNDKNRQTLDKVGSSSSVR